MSTRSTITVIDDEEKFHIYRHHDGYPDTEHGVVETLKLALPFAWPLPRFEACDFAAAIVRAWKGKNGGNIYFTTGPEAHGDTEYHYEVNGTSGKIMVQVFEREGEWNTPFVKKGKPHVIAPVKAAKTISAVVAPAVMPTFADESAWG